MSKKLIIFIFTLCSSLVFLLHTHDKHLYKNFYIADTVVDILEAEEIQSKVPLLLLPFLVLTQSLLLINKNKSLYKVVLSFIKLLDLKHYQLIFLPFFNFLPPPSL